MKYYTMIFIVLFAHNLCFSQPKLHNCDNYKITKLCKLFQKNFILDNLDQNFDTIIYSKKFDFLLFENKYIDSNTHKNIFYKIYYNNDQIVKISLFDSINILQNWDFDIIYQDNVILLSTIFFYKDFQRNVGRYFNGFLINRKKIGETLIFGFYSNSSPVDYFSKYVNAYEYKKNITEPYFFTKYVYKCIECVFFVNSNLIPVKQIVFFEEEAILFNEILYDFFYKKIYISINIANNKTYTKKGYRSRVKFLENLDKLKLKQLKYNNLFFNQSYHIFFELPLDTIYIRTIPFWSRFEYRLNTDLLNLKDTFF